MSAENTILVTCPYCKIERRVKQVGFRKAYHCRKCGAWALNIGEPNLPHWDWHESFEDDPSKITDKAVLFRRLFAQLAADMPAPEADYKFMTERKFMFDAAWPQFKFFVEIDGGNNMIRMNKNGIPVAVGRHTKDDDYEKWNLAVEHGYVGMRFTTKMLSTDPVGVVDQVRRMIIALHERQL